jgi:hypothetical protein
MVSIGNAKCQHVHRKILKVVRQTVYKFYRANDERLVVSRISQMHDRYTSTSILFNLLDTKVMRINTLTTQRNT